MWEVKEAGSRKQKGGQRVRALRGKGGAEVLAWGVSPESSPGGAGSRSRHSGIWARGFGSCVWNPKINRRGLTSQRVKVIPVMVGTSVRSKSPLLAGKRMALPELHIAISHSVLSKQPDK